MSKDPAFLFYSKDWLSGTMEMTAEEKGIYIDLLAHQHQNGSLPHEPKKLAKLCGMSESEFLIIWKEVATKFVANANGRLVNRKLNGIVSERVEKGWRNKIIGTLGAIVKHSGVSPEISILAKKTFKVDDFLGCDEQYLSAAVSEWYDKRLKSIANANGNQMGLKGGSGDIKGNWNTKPNSDFLNLPLPDIKHGAVFQLLTIKGEHPTPEIVSDLWEVFKKQWFTGEKFYSTENDAYSHFINWSKTQKINGTNIKSVNRNSKSAGAEQLIESLKRDIIADT